MSLQCYLYLISSNWNLNLVPYSVEFEIEISGRGFYVLNLRRQRVHMRCQISKFTVELLNKYMVLTFLGVNSGLCTLYLKREGQVISIVGTDAIRIKLSWL